MSMRALAHVVWSFALRPSPHSNPVPSLVPRPDNRQAPDLHLHEWVRNREAGHCGATDPAAGLFRKLPDEAVFRTQPVEYLAHPPRHEPMSEADPTDETTLNSEPSCEMCHQRGRAVCLSIASCPSFCPSIRICGMDEAPRGRSCKPADQGEHNADGLAGRS